GHTAAGAHGDETELLVASFEFVEDGADEDGAGGADGMPEGHGPAVDVDLVAVEAEAADELLRDDGERFVYLEQVDVREGQSRPLKDLACGRDGSVEHEGRVVAHVGGSHDAGSCPQAVGFGVVLAGDEYGGGTVDDARRVPGV